MFLRSHTRTNNGSRYHRRRQPVGRLIQGVRPFLERAADARLLAPANLTAALAAG